MIIINAFTSPYFMFGESVTASDVQNCIQVSKQDLGADIYQCTMGRNGWVPGRPILSHSPGILPYVHPDPMGRNGRVPVHPYFPILPVYVPMSIPSQCTIAGKGLDVEIVMVAKRVMIVVCVQVP